jgi:hypothetical protein
MPRASFVWPTLRSGAASRAARTTAR